MQKCDKYDRLYLYLKLIEMYGVSNFFLVSSASTAWLTIYMNVFPVGHTLFTPIASFGPEKQCLCNIFAIIRSNVEMFDVLLFTSPPKNYYN